MLTFPCRIALVGLAIICIGLSLRTHSQVRSAAASPSPSPTASPAPSPVPDFQANQVVVQLKPGASISDVNSRNGTATVGQIPATSYYLVAAIAQANPAQSDVLAQ